MYLISSATSTLGNTKHQLDVNEITKLFSRCQVQNHLQCPHHTSTPTLPHFHIIPNTIVICGSYTQWKSHIVSSATRFWADYIHRARERENTSLLHPPLTLYNCGPLYLAPALHLSHLSAFHKRDEGSFSVSEKQGLHSLEARDCSNLVLVWVCVGALRNVTDKLLPHQIWPDGAVQTWTMWTVRTLWSYLSHDTAKK